MLITVLKSMWDIMWLIIKLLAYITGPIIIPIALLMISNVLYLRFFKGIRQPYGEHNKVKQSNIFKKIFWDFPKQWAKDYMTRNPEALREHGLIIYCGEQGSGKTSSLVRDTLMLQKEYPKVKVIGNLKYKYQNNELKHWKQLITYKNGIQGVIVQIDELQNWFNSKQSKNFPPEMLEVVTQNRKNRRVIFGTAQNFYMLAKDIRSQTREIRQCITLCGCLTIVIRRKPIMNNDGEIEKLKFKGIYCYVHNDETRNAYDTYHVIHTLAKDGFKEETDQIRATNDIKIEIEEKKKGIFAKK